jgi:hypothetical protein
MCPVILLFTDVSEERTASILRVHEYVRQEESNNQNFNDVSEEPPRCAFCFLLDGSCLAFSSTLKMEVVNVYQTTWRHILKDSNLQYCKKVLEGHPALFADMADETMHGVWIGNQIY